MIEKVYSTPILHARVAARDFAAARNRYYSALREALPVGTPIRFTAHNGLKYDGVIAGPCRETGFVRIKNDKTGRDYEIGITYIEGL